MRPFLCCTHYSNLAIKLKKKITVSLVCTALVLAGIIIIPNAFAENVPTWIKNKSKIRSGKKKMINTT